MRQLRDRQLVIHVAEMADTPLAELVLIQDFLTAAGISAPTFAESRAHGNAPEPIAHLGKTPVWSLRQFNDWLDDRVQKGRRVQVD
jgi:hypothetical protein